MTRILRTRPHYLFRSFFRDFIRLEASSGILLILCAALALIWANSPWSDLYFGLWETHFIIGLELFQLDESLLHWINDGLMAIFFLVVGLEIKREVLTGELASLRQAALPIVAAAGGMLFPAAIYALINAGGSGSAGWGVPMATDIAFTLGAMALLGRRVPLSLKIFVTALAIVDDLGAVLAITFFYSGQPSLPPLLVAAAVLAVLAALNRAGVRRRLPYLLLGIVLWIAVLESGIHATAAGVLLALMIPARVPVNTAEFLAETRFALDEFEGTGPRPDLLLTEERRQSAVQVLEDAGDRIESPLHSLEHDLHPWVSYVILPIFALANAGVTLIGAEAAGSAVSPVSLGIVAGLVLGKPLGIVLMSWLAVRLRLAELPQGVVWGHVIGAGILAGIGFTMSIFIASLAFEAEPVLLASAKMGILAASLAAGVIGWLALRLVKAPPVADETNNPPDA